MYNFNFDGGGSDDDDDDGGGGGGGGGSGRGYMKVNKGGQNLKLNKSTQSHWLFRHDIIMVSKCNLLSQGSFWVWAQLMRWGITSNTYSHWLIPYPEWSLEVGICITF